MQHAAQRHRDNVDDYRREFLRTRVGFCGRDMFSVMVQLSSVEQCGTSDTTLQSFGLCP